MFLEGFYPILLLAGFICCLMYLGIASISLENYLQRVSMNGELHALPKKRDDIQSHILETPHAGD